MKLAIAAILVAVSGGVYAHGTGHEKKERANAVRASEEAPGEMAVGRAGDPAKVSRTIEVGMSDAMRFTPGRIQVRPGETVKFLVRNTGDIPHEMVLGTERDLREHAELMRKFPEMEHDEPNIAHVAPGESAELVWEFTRAGEFRYACLIPGHFEAGMAGEISVGQMR